MIARFAEFKAWWAQHDRLESLKIDADKEQEYVRAIAYFKYFDANLDGSIDREELKLLHADLVKNGLTKLSQEKLLEDLDANGDGVISFKEYVDWCVRPSMP